uniref:Putative secreted peptide n=1 Tax=Anopheles braziliensis TaxID=58242 RepID=A0A2M3ZXJ7_9DIPT
MMMMISCVNVINRCLSLRLCYAFIESKIFPHLPSLALSLWQTLYHHNSIISMHTVLHQISPYRDTKQSEST